MLKYFLAGLALAISPFAANIITEKIYHPQNGSKNEAVLSLSSSVVAPSPRALTPPTAEKDKPQKLPLAADIFLAAQDLLPIFPIRDWSIADIEIPAKGALVFETSQKEILFRKNNINAPRPIASLTKMMTALAAVENAKLDDIFVVSKKAVATTGEMGNLKVGERISLRALLYTLLMESSNDAAETIAENTFPTYDGAASREKFIAVMNLKAKTLGLKNTKFADPSGLDPANQSSAWDLTQIMQAMLKHDILGQIMQTREIDITNAAGENHHFTNSNKLLGRLPDIVGGKTGYTEEAGNCMILVVKSPLKDGFIISVVMDAQDRFAETESLIKWTKQAFLW